MWKNLALIRLPNRRFSTTVDANELQHFKQFTEEWWNETGHLRALHALNKLRVPFIRDGILSTKQEKADSKPLKNVSVLDVGCGGGILTEPLARIGANVTGIDANSQIIEKAKQRKNLQIQYFSSSIEEHSCENVEKYDAVVASEILEHVTQKEEFIDACVKCLKPGGSLFITTINKTQLSKILGVIVAENVLGLLPKGTHQHEKFIQPHHLERILEDSGCKTVQIQGMFYNFLKNEWYWCSDNSINYAVHSVKLKK